MDLMKRFWFWFLHDADVLYPTDEAFRGLVLVLFFLFSARLNVRLFVWTSVLSALLLVLNKCGSVELLPPAGASENNSVWIFSH